MFLLLIVTNQNVRPTILKSKATFEYHVGIELLQLIQYRILDKVSKKVADHEENCPAI